MSRDRFSPWATSPEYVRPAPIIRQPVRPEEIRARIAAEDATREGPGAAEYLRRIRDAADDEVTIPGLDVSFSPVALGMNAVPFSDEIMGLATDVLTHADYDEAQRASEQARYEASAGHLGSAILGGVGQAAITSPIALAGRAAGATRLARAARAILPATAVGAGLGAAGAATTAAARGEDLSASDRARAAMEAAPSGALAGGAIGTAAGALGAAGNAIGGSRSAILGVPARVIGSALGGAGYGVASTPDMSGREITDLPGLAMEAPGNAAVGGAFGAGAGLLGEMVGAGPRARNYVNHLFERLPAEEGAAMRPVSIEAGPANESIGALQEALPDMVDLPGVASDAVVPGGIEDVRAAAQAARNGARINTGDIIEDFVRTGLRRDPAVARLQSIGMTDAEINRASARFGRDPRRLVAAAREEGLLPARPYDPAEELAAIEAARTTSGRNVGRFREMLGNLDAQVPGGSIADEVQALADPLASRSSPAAQARADLLYRIADDLRYGVGRRPSVDPHTGEISLPDERMISPRELLGELDQYSNDLARAYRSADPGPNAEALMDVRQILARQRDQLAQRLEDVTVPGASQARNAAEEYAANNRTFQTTSALTGGRPGGIPGSDRRQYGQMRAMLGSFAGGQLGSQYGLPGVLAGRALGYLSENTLARYLPSLVATANEGGFANPGGPVWPGATQAIREMVSTPAVPPRVDAALQGVERLLGTNPSAFGRLEGVLRGAASRGTLAAVVTYLASTNPEFAALVQRVSPEDEQRAQQQTIESAERDPLLIGADPSAPPPVDENDDGTDELIYGTPAR